MEIILHRANTLGDWMRAQSNGWGIEADIRTHCGVPYISHDAIEQYFDWMPSLCQLLEFSPFIQNTVVLDFKESGLMKYVPEEQPNLVCTDLIVPDQIWAAERGIRTLTRRSVYENIDVSAVPVKNWIGPRPPEYWVDYVLSAEDLKPSADIASAAFVVSPELHSPQAWVKCQASFIKAVYDMGFAGVCTDYPEEYEKYAKP